MKNPQKIDFFLKIFDFSDQECWGTGGVRRALLAGQTDFTGRDGDGGDQNGGAGRHVVRVAGPVQRGENWGKIREKLEINS